MPAMSKAQLIEKIQEYGETPPSTWGKTQLEGRLAELKHLHQVEEGSQTKSRVAELNKAARKKDHLLAYMKDNNIQHSGHETISQLLALGHRHILETTSPRGSDAMGFGKHANLTYSEVANQDWNDVQWMLTTCQEAGGLKGTSDWRLKRFIQWYTHGQKGIQKPAGSSKKVENSKDVKSQGYAPKTYAMNSPRQEEKTDSSFTVISAPVLPTETEEEMETISETELEIQRLEGQLRDLQRAKKERSSRAAPAPPRAEPQ